MDREASIRNRKIQILEQHFRDPIINILGPPYDGTICENIRRALRVFGYDVKSGTTYDKELEGAIFRFQNEYNHHHLDGLFGPGTRHLLSSVIFDKLGDQAYSSIIEDRPVVFVSYSHKDKRLVQALAKFLLENDIEPWIDEGELAYGDSLIDRLSNAIDTVDLVLAVISSASVSSSWVQKELDIAMNREIEKRRVTVIPILCDESDLPGFLKGKFYADFSTKHKRQINRQKLVWSIKQHVYGEA